MFVDGGQHFEQRVGDVGAEVEHIGVVQVVVGSERVGNGVADVVGAIAPCFSADSRTSTRLSYNETGGLKRTAAEEAPIRTLQGNPEPFQSRAPISEDTGLSLVGQQLV